MNVGVAIASNGRCGPLLLHLVELWLRLGAHVAVAGDDGPHRALDGVFHDRLRLVRTSDKPQHQGDQIAAAFEALAYCDYVLRTDDDILPVGGDSLLAAANACGGWIERLEGEPGSIRSVRMIDILGRRWFDWACRTNAGAFVQAYDTQRPRTFITGGCQLWSREARAAVSYAGRPYRTGADAQICEDAVARGIRLLPPSPNGPLLIHLDRKPKHINAI